MPVESQSDFSGGLNDRLPPHKIGANQCAELQNVDLSFGDLRGEYQTLSGGQSDYYYEKADRWVSAEGFTESIAISSFSSSTQTISTNSNFYSPMTIGSGHTVTIGSNITVQVYEVTTGVHGASAFVEYNDDLYVARGAFTVTGTWSNSSNTNRLTIETATTNVGEAYKLQVGDELTGTNLPDDVFVTRIATATNHVFINRDVTASGTDVTISVNPIISKFLDGDTSESFRVSALKPDPTINFEQDATYGSNADRAAGHSASWYSANFVVPFQYGLAHFDHTGYESTMSSLTDSSLSNTYFTSSNNIPMYINFGAAPGSSRSITDLAHAGAKTRGGRFAFYRVGGSSAVIKKLDNLFIDEDLSIAVSGSSGNNLTVAITGGDTGHQYRVGWLNFKTGAATKYEYSNGSYSVAATHTGKTDYKSGATSHNFVLTGSGSTHHTDLVVYLKIPGELVEREYVTRMLSVNNADVSNANTFDYIDFQSSDSLVDIQPIESDNEPPKASKYLIESGNIFYAVVDTRLFASDYGNPNSYRTGAFIDFDQKITGLSSIGSELVVFTEYGVYRVFGSDPFGLKKVRVPTTEGVPDGGSKTIVKFQGGIMFASHQGICFYNGKSVERLSHGLINDFTYPNNTTKASNAGGIYDDVYYLLGNSGTGYKVDLKAQPLKVIRSSFNASKLYYRGADNILYADTGRPGYATGSRSNFNVKTRKFSGGDINLEKIFKSARLTGESFFGTVTIFVDDTQTDTFTVSSSVSDFDRTFYLDQPRQGNGLQVRLSSAYGNVHRVNIDFDAAANATRKIYEAVQIQYTGTPSVTVSLDGADLIGEPSSTVLSAPSGAVGEAMLYFPEMTTGLVPHIKETTDEVSGRILSYQFIASNV